MTVYKFLKVIACNNIGFVQFYPLWNEQLPTVANCEKIMILSLGSGQIYHHVHVYSHVLS